MCDSPVNCKPVSKHHPQNSGCQVKSTSGMHNFRRALLPTQAILDPSSNSQTTGTLGMASEHSLSILFSKRPTCGPQLKMPRASRAYLSCEEADMCATKWVTLDRMCKTFSNCTGSIPGVTRFYNQTEIYLITYNADENLRV